jgi:hypothetical protein
MAIWEKPASGDPLAPYDDPIANFGLVRFHSDFQYLSNSLRVNGISVSHASVAGVTGSGYTIPSSGGFATGPIANGQIVVTDKLLYTHSLGYVPQFMVLYNGAIVYGGTCVQQTADRLKARFVSAYATTTEIRLQDIGISNSDALPAASVSYDVLIFRDPSPIGGDPLYRNTPDEITLGYGRITSEQRPLRRAVGAEGFFYIPLDRTSDIRNGAYRTISPAGAVDLGPYFGSFFSAEYIKVTY